MFSYRHFRRANNKDADQTVRMRRLIRTFVVRMYQNQGLKRSLSKRNYSFYRMSTSATSPRQEAGRCMRTTNAQSRRLISAFDICYLKSIVVNPAPCKILII